MYSYSLIKYPKKFDRSDYDQVFNHITKTFKDRKEVKSIFTFGNVNQPGISDIDILIIFKDGYQCNINPLESLEERLKWLFTHGVMAINEKYILENNHFSNWSNIKHLHGQLIDFTSNKPSAYDQICLNKQLALEYLTINYIDLKIQKQYKTIKVRDLLQHVKGLSYDLELLNLENSNILPYIEEVKSWINNWHLNTPNKITITNWFIEFEKQYESFYTEIIQQNPLYLPKQSNYQISKRIKILKADKVKHISNGITLPAFTSNFLGKYYLKLQNRINTHTFEIPIESQPSNSILVDRTNFYKELDLNTTSNYPAFATLANNIIRSIQ